MTSRISYNLKCSACLGRYYLLRLSEMERPTLNLGDTFWWQSTSMPTDTMTLEKESFASCLLAVSAISKSIYPVAYIGTTSFASIRTHFFGIQHRLKTSSYLGTFWDSSTRGGLLRHPALETEQLSIFICETPLVGLPRPQPVNPSNKFHIDTYIFI